MDREAVKEMLQVIHGSDRQACCDSDVTKSIDDVNTNNDDDLRTIYDDMDPAKQSCLSSCRQEFFGYQLVILFAAFMFVFIAAGILYTGVGLYYVAWMDEFDAGSWLTSSLGSIMLGITSFTSPVSSLLVERFGFRCITMAGGMIACAGFVASVYANSIYTLIVTYSIITPIGIGLAYVPASTIVSMYFDRQRITANGIYSSGVGFGNFAMAFITAASIEKYHWRGSMFISASVVLQICVIGALLREPKSWTKIKEQRSLVKRTSTTLPRFFHICRNRGLLVYFFHMLLVSAGFSVVYVHLAATIESLGLSRNDATFALSLMGIANVFGRIGSGMLGQQKSVDTFLFYTLCMVTCGVSAILLPFLRSYHVVMTWSVIFGLLMAPNMALFQINILYFVDISELNVAFGHANIFVAVGLTVGAPLAGCLIDASKDYSGAFFLGGSFILLGSLILVIPYIIQRRKLRFTTTLVEEEKATAMPHKTTEDTENNDHES